VLNKNVYRTRTGRYALVESQPFQPEFAHQLPGVPALPETLLLMDLKMHESCVDLRELSQLVLNDLGATLQILRLAGLEYGGAEDRPNRIEDCISGLGLQACLEAASARTVTCGSRHQAIAETWSHSRMIAQCARIVAEDMPGTNPDEAYLVGFFHAIGMLPSVLGWDWREPGPADGALAGYRMARSWFLPQCVIDFFAEINTPAAPRRWSGIVRTAHRLSERSPMNCLFEQSLRPQLHRRA
jgi:HD-like signal output (HDOD) protein